MPLPAIEYFYSAHSAYAYFGSSRFMQIAAAANHHIDHRPVNLDQVLEGAGSVAFRARSAKLRNYFFSREMERWAEYRGVKTLGRRPTYHHHSPHLANRMLIAALDQGRNVDKLAHRMLEAHWGEDADLSLPDTLIEIAEATNLPGTKLLTLADSQAILDRYAENTAEAVERSFFGSPTYVVAGDPFYGQDHLELVERALQKPFANTWPPIEG